MRDLCRAFKEGKFPDSMTNDNYVNVRTVKTCLNERVSQADPDSSASGCAGLKP